MNSCRKRQENSITELNSIDFQQNSRRTQLTHIRCNTVSHLWPPVSEALYTLGHKRDSLSRLWSNVYRASDTGGHSMNVMTHRLLWWQSSVALSNRNKSLFYNNKITARSFFVSFLIVSRELYHFVRSAVALEIGGHKPPGHNPLGQNPLSVARPDKTPGHNPCREHNVQCRFLLQESGFWTTGLCPGVYVRNPEI